MSFVQVTVRDLERLFVFLVPFYLEVQVLDSQGKLDVPPLAGAVSQGLTIAAAERELIVQLLVTDAEIEAITARRHRLATPVCLQANAGVVTPSECARVFVFCLSSDSNHEIDGWTIKVWSLNFYNFDVIEIAGLPEVGSKPANKSRRVVVTILESRYVLQDAGL